MKAIPISIVRKIYLNNLIVNLFNHKSIFLFILFFATSGLLPAQTINSDSSKVEFSISKLKKNTVDGVFTGVKGEIEINDSNLVSINVCIDPATVNTWNKRRDAHLRNPDYFDVENYPTICFESDSISQTDSGFIASGTMTMLDISKEEQIPLQITDYGLTGEFVVDRYDYDIGDEKSNMIGRIVTLRIYCVFSDEDYKE